MEAIYFMIEAEGYVAVYSLGSLHSSLATLDIYLHVRLWLLWSTIDSMHCAILPLYWGLVNGALSAMEAI